MLQIRLSKGGGGSSGNGGGVPGGKLAATVETVTVACPDHLVLADLPVAKSLGAVTASAVRSVGRRSLRHLGERVHFCVRCDFPIAIYGRIVRTLSLFLSLILFFLHIFKLILLMNLRYCVLRTASYDFDGRIVEIGIKCYLFSVVGVCLCRSIEGL